MAGNPGELQLNIDQFDAGLWAKEGLMLYSCSIDSRIEEYSKISVCHNSICVGMAEVIITRQRGEMMDYVVKKTGDPSKNLSRQEISERSHTCRPGVRY